MKTLNFTSLVFILLFMSCKDDNTVIIDKPIEPLEPLITDTILVWKVPLHPDTLNSVSIDPHFEDGKIISSGLLPFASDTEVIFALDRDGNEIWTWEDYAPEITSKKAGHTIFSENYLLVSSHTDNYSINMNNGTTNWIFVEDHGGPRMSFNEELDLVFKTFKNGQAPRGDSTYIELSSHASGEFKEVFKIIKTDDYEVHIPTVASYLNSEGDTILIFQNRQIVVSPYDGKIDLYAYNLTQKEIQWFKEDIGDGESNVRAPLIDGDYVYYCGQFHVFCYEKESGNLVFERKLHHTFQGANFLIWEDLFITNLDNGDLIAINKLTGDTEWVKENLTGCCTELRIFDDKVYLANGDLYILQASTGRLLFQYETPTQKEKGRGNADFLNAVAVDLENKMMYTTDSYYLLKMRLPDF
jgi:outer membrane protein assembly factor BamB